MIANKLIWKSQSKKLVKNQIDITREKKLNLEWIYNILKYMELVYIYSLIF